MRNDRDLLATESQRRRQSMAVCVLLLVGLAGEVAAEGPEASATQAAPIRAAYMYHYMPPVHLEDLAAHGFDTALVKLVGEELDDAMLAALRSKVALGATLDLRVFAVINANNTAVLATTAGERRFRDARGRTYDTVACPADTTYWAAWRQQLLAPVLAEVSRIAIDFEIYNVSDFTHWPTSPCTCRDCLLEYTGYTGENAGLAPIWLQSEIRRHDLEDLARSQRLRLQESFARWLDELHDNGVEIAFLDLGRPGLVTRSMSLALATTGVPALDFTELSYSDGIRVSRETLTEAYAGLDAAVTLVGGLWLLRWDPSAAGHEAQALARAHDGYWIFTSLSLSQPPEELYGPYRLNGDQEAYWSAFRAANVELTTTP